MLKPLHQANILYRYKCSLIIVLNDVQFQRELFLLINLLERPLLLPPLLPFYNAVALIYDREELDRDPFRKVKEVVESPKEK